MAKDKNSFILYADLIHTVDQMPDEKAGHLFKVILEYVNDKNPNIGDLLVKIAFEPIKQQLKRDLKKWDKYIDKQRLNGQKGGRPRKPEKPKEPKPLNENPSEPKKADSVNVNVSDNVSDNVTNKQERELKFKEDVFSFSEYSEDIKQEFFEYWTETKPKGKKMLFELQRTWDTKRRLSRWAKNAQTNFGRKEKVVDIGSPEYYKIK